MNIMIPTLSAAALPSRTLRTAASALRMGAARALFAAVRLPLGAVGRGPITFPGGGGPATRVQSGDAGPMPALQRLETEVKAPGSDG